VICPPSLSFSVAAACAIVPQEMVIGVSANTSIKALKRRTRATENLE
jgi:hypothetical protein